MRFNVRFKNMKEDPVGKIVKLTQAIERSGWLTKFWPGAFDPKIEFEEVVGRIVSVTYREEDCEQGYYMTIPTFTIKMESGHLVSATTPFWYDKLYGVHHGYVGSENKTDGVEFTGTFEILDV